MRSLVQRIADLFTIDRKRMRRQVHIIVGDITAMVAGDSRGVIVNAANISLLGGGGVDGAIHRAAGPELRDYCEKNFKILSNGGRIFAGDATVVPSFNLRCRGIILTVGPDCRDERQNCTREATLRSCYTSCLNSIPGAGDDIARIYFPAISTGVYGYDLREATEVALRAINDVIKQPAYVNPDLQIKQRAYVNPDLQIILVAFNNAQGDVMRQVYHELVEKW